jgi:VanZ family protein
MKTGFKTLNLLIIAYVLAILILSVASINANGLSSLSSTRVLNIRSDYLLHVLLFIPWMVLISLRWKEKKGVGFFILALLAGLLLATISEVGQYVVPYRSFNVFDLISNCVGLVIGAMISVAGRLKTAVSS